MVIHVCILLRAALMRIFLQDGYKSIYQLPDSFGNALGLGASVLWGKMAGLLTYDLSFHIVELSKEKAFLGYLYPQASITAHYGFSKTCAITADLRGE